MVPISFYVKCWNGKDNGSTTTFLAHVETVTAGATDSSLGIIKSLHSAARLPSCAQAARGKTWSSDSE